MQKDTLHPFCWLWLPVSFMGLQLVLEFTQPVDILTALHNEGGAHEIVQFVIIFAAFIVALVTAISRALKDRPFLRAWLVLAELCCLYVAGEEMSWGQHILHWSTPEYWAAINDQQETNFHNTSSWLDQKPRLILEIGVIVGGLLFPLLQKYKPSLLPSRFAVIYPAVNMWVIAALVLFMKFADKLAPDMFYRDSEVGEIYLFYFVLVYLLTLRRRILQQ
jgi:hypothetical protein